MSRPSGSSDRALPVRPPAGEGTRAARFGPCPSAGRGRANGGYSILEVVVVLVVVAVVLAVGIQGFRMISQDIGPRRSAEVFARDLMLARGAATRERQPVVIEFLPAERTYSVVTAEGREVIRRRFDGAGEVSLSAIALQLPGNSVTFDPRGIADLSGASDPLGIARFEAGSTIYLVRFNSLGASRVERQ